jgi:crotonobetainyl-CoA:carnitine CoA-transferase CaiB-like acyl-CoA transferase
MDGLFEDLLVIDCASFIAGPAAATMLADFGARVIKIEPPVTGDSYRQLKHLPSMPPSEHDYSWLLDNRNKESLALDLKQAPARAIFETLLKRCDVFITNYPGPVREKLRLRADDLLPLNPRLIYASITPYGESGPEKDRTGYDATAWWARSGLMDHVRASPDAAPGLSVPGMGDHPTAATLFAGIAAALYRREKTGKGGHVSTSLLANGLWSNAVLVQAALCGADLGIRRGRGERSALTELYCCKDGRWFMLVIINDTRDWPRLLACLGKGEWASDPRFATADARKANAAQLVALLEQVFAGDDWAHWQVCFEAAAIPVGAISRTTDHIADRQIAANDFFRDIAGVAGVKTIDNPVQIAGCAKVPPRKAPEIGQHTGAILRELGLAQAEIAALAECGAAGL